MKSRPKLYNSISRQAAVSGWAYYAFELLFLPGLFADIAARLGIGDAGANFVYYLLNFFFTVSIFREYLTGSLEKAGKRMGRFLWAVVIGFILCFLADTGLNRLTQQLLPDFVNINDQTVSTMVREHPFGMLLGTAVLVPPVEECLFRGLIFSQLYPKSKPLAYAVSILAFCAIHVMGYVGSASPATLAVCFMQYIPAGLVLGWAYAHCGSILAPILIHAAINAVAVLTVV